jgi:LPS O-antigen subunit length determinant protein (WzzB/FepE family)
MDKRVDELSKEIKLRAGDKNDILKGYGALRPNYDTPDDILSLLYLNSMQQVDTFSNELRRNSYVLTQEKAELLFERETIGKEMDEIAIKVKNIKLEIEEQMLQKKKIKNQIEKVMIQKDTVNNELHNITIKEEIIVPLRIIMEPQASLDPVKPRKKFYVIVAFLVSLFIVVAFAFVAAYIEGNKSAGKDIA